MKKIKTKKLQLNIPVKPVNKKLVPLVDNFIGDDLYLDEFKDILKDHLDISKFSDEQIRTNILTVKNGEIGFIDNRLVELFEKWQIYFNLKDNESAKKYMEKEGVKKFIDNIYNTLIE